MLPRKSLTPTHATTGLWPTEQQRLLLKATVLNEAEALEAFGQWRASIAEQAPAGSEGADLLDTLDHATLRLLPLLHHRLQTFNVDADPMIRRIADVYLDSWMRLNHNLSFVLPLLRLLEENAIDNLLLKGLPIAYEYYPLPATRPMADFDVLIKTVDRHKTVQILADAGWHPTRKLIAGDFRFRHAQSFINSQGVEFDFHWHVMPAASNSEADEKFWQRSQHFRLEGAATRRLDATDCLLHTLVHGVHAFAWNAEPAIRWVPDSALLLQSEAENIDWDRIVVFGKQYQLTHRLALALGYLRYDMGLRAIPAATIEKLEAYPVSLLERLEHRPRRVMAVEVAVNSGPVAKTSLIDKLVQFLRYKCGRARQKKQSGFLAELLAFAIYKHRVSSFRDLMRLYAAGMSKLVRPGRDVKR